MDPTSSHNPLSSPSPLSATPLLPFEDIPALSLDILDIPEDTVQGLTLVADSVAQMRQRASKALVTHPVCLAGLSVGLAAVYRFSQDLGTGIMLACGVTMVYLLGIRWFTDGYIRVAEQIGWSWLQNPEGEQDIILGARYNDTIIGALVLRISANTTKRKSRSDRLRGGRGIIRAWTTKLKFRGQGIGRDMLLQAVRITKEKCGKDAEVGFAKEHANSTMLLPGMFNQAFRRDEVRATRTLDDALAEWEISKRKR